MPGFYDAVKRAVPNLLLIHSLIPDANYYYGFNSVSWYLSSLGVLYLCSSFFLWCVRKISEPDKGLIITILIYVSMTFIIGKIGLNLQWLLYISPIMRSFDFVMGMLIAKKYLKCSEMEICEQIEKYKCFDLIGLFFFIIALICYNKVPEQISYSLIFLPGSLLMIMGTTINAGKSVLGKILSAKLFNYINMISLELYLTHQVIINYLNNYSIDVSFIPNMVYYPLIIFGTVLISIFIKMLTGKMYK